MEIFGTLIPLRAHAWVNTDGVRRACLHDPAVYEDPEAFRPERFLRDGKLNPDVPDPDQFSFGFGRRYVLRLTTLIGVYSDSGH